MRYEGDIYSPHIAGDDYILQCTIGCSHNQCTFCYMYKNKQYRVRELQEILADIDLAKEAYDDVKKVFLADGDALSMPAIDLLKILDYLYTSFPGLVYVGTYASAASILNKTPAELKELRQCGLVEAHLGVESGDVEILRAVRKGASYAEMVEAGLRLKQSGIDVFVTAILGLAGKTDKAWNHAKNTARICNEIQPDYIGLLTVILQPGTELFDKAQKKEFIMPDEWELLKELRLMLEHMELKHTGITSIHPSNCVSLEGWLPDDKVRLLETVTRLIDSKDFSQLRKRATDRV
jgi:radical SAM superfamily enzyme YgiQ (UPF0313 family)